MPSVAENELFVSLESKGSEGYLIDRPGFNINIGEFFRFYLQLSLVSPLQRAFTRLLLALAYSALPVHANKQSIFLNKF